MNRLEKLILGACVLCIVQTGMAANYILENSTNSFWSTPQSWHDAAVWKDGVVVPSGASNDVSMSSKPVDHTVNLSDEAVDLDTLKVGIFANDADLVTLNVTTNLDLSWLRIGYDGGNAAMVVSNTTVTVSNKVYLGSVTTNAFSGNLTVNSGGIVEVEDVFDLYTNGILTVNGGGVVKMLAPAGSRISMVESAKVYLNDDAEIWLNGNHTGAGSVFNGYVNSGWVYGDGIVGNVKSAIDITAGVTNTIVTVAPIQLGTATIQNNDASFWAVPRSWHDGRIWKDGLPSTLSTVIMTAKPVDYTVNLIDAPVTIKYMKSKFGPTGAAGTVTPTLNVLTNLTINNVLQLGVDENGAMIVDGVNLVLVKGDTTLGSASFKGSLAVTNGGVMRCNNPLIMNTNSVVTINNGILKAFEHLAVPLSMSDGAVIDIIGTNSTFQIRGNQTGAGTDLSTYINNGWIIGDGGASALETDYDSTNNLTRVYVFGVPGPTYAGFTDEYGITGMTNSAPQEDYDGDGQLNIYEFGLGGNPTNSSDIGTEPVYEIVNQGGTNVMKYVHVRLVDAEITYHLETDTDLVLDPGWTNAGWSVESVGAEIDGFEVVTNVVDASADVGFVRLVIE